MDIFSRAIDSRGGKVFRRRKGRAWRETFIVNRLSLIVIQLRTPRILAKVIYDPPFVFPPSQFDTSYSKYQPARNKVVSWSGNVTRVERFSSPPPILQDDTFRDVRCHFRNASDRSTDTSGSSSPMRRNENTEKGISFVLYLAPIFKKSLHFYTALSPHPLYNSLNRSSTRSSAL